MHIGDQRVIAGRKRTYIFNVLNAHNDTNALDVPDVQLNIADIEEQQNMRT